MKYLTLPFLYLFWLAACLTIVPPLHARPIINPYRFAAGGGGGPALIASDNFDAYVNSAALGDEANWVQEGGSTMNINKPGADSSVIPAGAASLCRHVATMNANHRAEVTLDAVAAGGGFDWIGPAVRIQSGAVTGYTVVVSSTDIYLISINAGTPTTINSDTSFSLAAGNKVAIECSGAGASARLKVQVDTGSGWVDKWTNQDPALDLDGGFAGLGCWLFSTPNNRVDDFACYDL